jgi:nitrogen fixation-related uncharacterized protein
MYLASFIVVAAVGLTLLVWAGFMLWGFRSGQFKGMDELRRRPLDDEIPTQREDHG